jgi:hypothetical protein
MLRLLQGSSRVRSLYCAVYTSAVLALFCWSCFGLFQLVSAYSLSQNISRNQPAFITAELAHCAAVGTVVKYEPSSCCCCLLAAGIHAGKYVRCTHYGQNACEEGAPFHDNIIWKRIVLHVAERRTTPSSAAIPDLRLTPVLL